MEVIKTGPKKNGRPYNGKGRKVFHTVYLHTTNLETKQRYHELRGKLPDIKGEDLVDAILSYMENICKERGVK